MYIRPRIIPVLLIDDRELVKTVRFRERTYLGDPVNAVKIFNRKRIDELMILDIGAAKNKREPDYEMLRDIASEAFMPLSYGGGITSAEQAKELVKTGYEKIVINTQLVRNPGLVRQTADVLGSQSVVASIDARLVHGKYMCAVEDGQKTVKVSPKTLAKRAEKLGAGEILINSADRDGTMDGYDLRLVRNVAESVSIPVTACGGAGSVQDLEKVLHKGHAHAAAGGSMFVFYGRLRAVLITAPSEKELTEAGVHKYSGGLKKAAARKNDVEDMHLHKTDGGRSGILVKYGDMEALAQAADTLLYRGTDQEILSETAKKVYSSSRMSEDYLKLYQEI